MRRGISAGGLKDRRPGNAGMGLVGVVPGEIQVQLRGRITHHGKPLLVRTGQCRITGWPVPNHRRHQMGQVSDGGYLHRKIGSARIARTDGHHGIAIGAGAVNEIVDHLRTRGLVPDQRIAGVAERHHVSDDGNIR